MRISEKWITEDLVHGHDHGDLCNRTSLVGICMAVLSGPEALRPWYQYCVSRLVKDGWVYRSPIPGYWPYHLRNCSRDQTSNLINWALVMGDFDTVNSIRSAWADRCYFGQNKLPNYLHDIGTDPAWIKDDIEKYPIAKESDLKTPDPATPGFYRILKTPTESQWSLRLLDMSLVADVKLAKSHWDSYIQLFPSIIACNLVKPTPSAKEAFNQIDREFFVNQVKNYFKDEPDGNGIPELADLMIETYDHLKANL